MTSRWHGLSAPLEEDCPGKADAVCCRPTAELSEGGAEGNSSPPLNHLPCSSDPLDQQRQSPETPWKDSQTPQSDSALLPGDLGLDADLWREIFSHLPLDALPAAAGVCKVWSGVISDPQVWAASFVHRWKLRKVHGEPVSRAFWRGGLGQFVVAHRLEPQDSVVSLAIKFGVEVTAVKRQNNIISEHSIHVRERLLIPVPDAKFLEGKDCFVETDNYSRREVAVLYVRGSPRGQESLQTEAAEGGKNAGALARSKERFREKMVQTLRKGIKVDDATARYYLAQSGWDLRGAYAAFQVDTAWESQRQPRWLGRS
ncbi:LysM domain containing protein [Klebsormidium nitens]|uniref:LysM domain containing protein n=1 Tax=Klebsormidium nitens TaxID=105231 RepID=A0A1Y1IJT7_KLENI|nr:LysM domain containing protein [Klebsormidium nitens]|eukprot:GAQ88408.1 LysM domain containing protein [Klebsormidium nitens]